MVVGRWMVSWGVRLRGVSGPKAPPATVPRTGFMDAPCRKNAALHSRSRRRCAGVLAPAADRPTSASCLGRHPPGEAGVEGQVVGDLERAAADQRPAERAGL